MIKWLPQAWIVSGVAVLLALTGAYLQGRSDGQAVAEAKAHRQLLVQRQASFAAQNKIDHLEVQYERAQATRAERARVVRSKAVTISHAPNYARACFDPDGLRLVNDAIASANTRQPQPSPAMP